MPTLLLTLTLVLTGGTAPTEHAHLAAARLTSWYAARGVVVTITEAPPVMLTVDLCPPVRWWRDLPRTDGIAYLYLVDSQCPVYLDLPGVAYPSLGVALVNLPAPGMDAVLAHEVGHLLGAADHPMGYDLMSNNMGQGYVEGLLSVATWHEMGGPAPTYTVALPMVNR